VPDIFTTYTSNVVESSYQAVELTTTVPSMAIS